MSATGSQMPFMLSPQEAPRGLVSAVFDDLKGLIECFGHQHHGYVKLVFPAFCLVVGRILSNACSRVKSKKPGILRKNSNDISE